MSSEPRLPIDSELFWRNRLSDARLRGEIHRTIWDVDIQTWDAALESHRRLLFGLLAPTQRAIRLLDCGCGIGALVSLLPPWVEYTGVDVSPDLIEEAKARHPGRAGRFHRGNLRALPWSPGSFDVAICRGLEGAITANLGVEAWREMEREIVRVADRVVVLSYSRPTVANVYDSPRVRRVSCEGTMLAEGGKLVYRDGQDSTAEIFDISVDEGYRRRGVGRSLVDRLFAEFRSVFAFTRETNDGAKRFYRALGFTETPLPGFYRGEDALFFHRSSDAGIVSVDPLR